MARSPRPLLAETRARRARWRQGIEAVQAWGGLGGRTLEELLRLDAEGLLDGSNALAGLKAIVDELRALDNGTALREAA